MKISPIEVTYIDHMGSDLSIVNAARVSFHKESEFEEVEVGGFDGTGYITEYVKQLSEKDAKLIRYLAKHKHHSPFNHTFITVRVKAPLFISRQLVKHKFMPWNEVSRRYVDDEPEFYFPEAWRGKAENVKQGSSGTLDDNQSFFRISTYTHSTVQITLDCYEELLKCGVAPEQARMVLPQNMMTEWYWSGTLGAFGDMLKLRLDPHTQEESRIVANKIKDVILPHFPVGLPAILEN